MSTKKPKALPAAEKALTAKEARFVEEILKDFNATRAATDAGYSARTAAQTGYKLLTKAHIQAAMQAAMAERSERVQFDADDVLRRWIDIADADPRELIEYRRTCCRNCYGVGFHYQHTQHEIEASIESHRRTWERRENQLPDDVFTPPEHRGGNGYDRRKPPHKNCPHCFGEGVEAVFARDSRLLSPRGARLYAGVKETKEGIEIKMRDQDAALLNIAKHLGMHVTKTELTGKDGKDLLPPSAIHVTLIAPKEPAS